MNAASGAVLVVALECPTLAIALETMFTKVAPLTLSLFYQTEEKSLRLVSSQLSAIKGQVICCFFCTGSRVCCLDLIKSLWCYTHTDSYTLLVSVCKYKSG